LTIRHIAGHCLASELVSSLDPHLKLSVKQLLTGAYRHLGLALDPLT
jgi:hypothetical protein